MSEVENNICPACQEQANLILSCGHPIHKACLRKLVKLECPLCRKNLEEDDKIPANVINRIKQNEIDFKTELADESFNDFIRNEENERRLRAYAMTLEIRDAIQYLHDNMGIDMQYLQNVNIQTPPMPFVQPGDMFRYVITSFLLSLGLGGNDINDPLDADDEEDDEENEEEVQHVCERCTLENQEENENQENLYESEILNENDDQENDVEQEETELSNS